MNRAFVRKGIWGTVPLAFLFTVALSNQPQEETCRVEARWSLKSTRQADLPVPNFGSEQTCCLVLDVDKDGIDDFVVGERTQAPSLVWYKWNGKGWYRYVIDDGALSLEAGGATGDIDGDGDTDIIVGEDYRGNKIWWWENPTPRLAQLWKRRIIKDFGERQHHDQGFGDFLGVGRSQLISWNQKAKALLLFKTPDDPKNASRWETVEVYHWSVGPQHEGLPVRPVDVDLDNKPDIVGGGRWFKHLRGEQFETQVIDEQMACTRCAVGQLIPGGRVEVVFSPAEETGMARWYTWDGKQWVAHDLGYVRHGHTCQIEDFNQDGYLDILIGEMGTPGAGDDAKIFIWYGNGRGHFHQTLAAHGLAIHDGKVGDFNGDGRPDILVKPYGHRTPRIDVLLNTGVVQLPLDRWQRVQVGTMPHRAVFVSAADFDSDGLLDIAAGAWWWKHPEHTNDPWTRHTIGDPMLSIAAVYDFDGDTHADILGTKGKGSEANREFVWAAGDGQGNFQIFENIQYEGGGDFLQGCIVGSLHEGLKVFLSWHRDGGGIFALSVPADVRQAVWNSQLVSTTVSTPPQGEDLALGDIENDGDLDVLLGDKWLRNDKGQWTAFTLGMIDVGEPDRCRLVDINTDGRLDAVVTLEKGTAVYWFEQPEKSTGPWTRRQLGTAGGQGFSMDVADFDADGWPDVVVGEHAGTLVNRVLIFKNPGATMVDQDVPWPVIIVDEGPRDQIDHHDGTLAYDLDRDGDLDIVSIGWYNPAVWVYLNQAISKK